MAHRYRNNACRWICRVLGFAIPLLFGAPQQVLAAERLSIGSLSLDWPDGYKSERLGDAILLRGPDDERVVISYVRGRNHFAKDQRERFARMHSIYALRTLPGMAARHGVVVQALRTTYLRDGTVIYSTASQLQHATRESYYLQYFVVGPFSIALFKIEGEGETMGQKTRFDGLFKSSQWNETRVSARFR
jgi:hypothetical protein